MVYRRNASTGPPKGFGDRTKSGGFYTQKMMPVSLVAQPLLAVPSLRSRHLSFCLARPAPLVAQGALTFFVSGPGVLFSFVACLSPSCALAVKGRWVPHASVLRVGIFVGAATQAPT
jgi:hypothetical protein